jgi:hypothetical protein
MEEALACRDKQGTVAGYHRHRYYKQEVCDPCRLAFNDYRQKERDGRSPEWREGHKRYMRAYGLRKKYGITEDQFSAILEAQGGTCAICWAREPGGRNWCVDHDHSCCPGKQTCGKCIRGLLCVNCNGKLGWYEANQLEVGWYLQRGRNRQC